MNAPDPAVLDVETCDFTVLENVDALGVCPARIAPGHGVMPHGPAAFVPERPHDRKARVVEIQIGRFAAEFVRPQQDRARAAKMHGIATTHGGVALGIGVIDIKDNGVESEDLIASRIEASIDTLGEERIKWIHPDCGFWMLSRSVSDRKMAALVKGRDKFLGR